MRAALFESVGRSVGRSNPGSPPSRRRDDLNRTPLSATQPTHRPDTRHRPSPTLAIASTHVRAVLLSLTPFMRVLVCSCPLSPLLPQSSLLLLTMSDDQPNQNTDDAKQNEVAPSEHLNLKVKSQDGNEVYFKGQQRRRRRQTRRKHFAIALRSAAIDDESAWHQKQMLTDIFIVLSCICSPTRAMAHVY